MLSQKQPCLDPYEVHSSPEREFNSLELQKSAPGGKCATQVHGYFTDPRFA